MHTLLEQRNVRGLAPETQVNLSRYSVTIELCDSYCLGIGDYQVVRWRSLSRTGPTVGNDDKGEIERRGGYQTSEGVEERVDCES